MMVLQTFPEIKCSLLDCPTMTWPPRSPEQASPAKDHGAKVANAIQAVLQSGSEQQLQLISGHMSCSLPCEPWSVLNDALGRPIMQAMCNVAQELGMVSSRWQWRANKNCMVVNKCLADSLRCHILAYDGMSIAGALHLCRKYRIHIQAASGAECSAHIVKVAHD